MSVKLSDKPRRHYSGHRIVRLILDFRRHRISMRIHKTFYGSFGMVLLLILSCAVVATAAAARTGRIAFASTRDGNTEIYTMKSDGTDQVRLTNNTSVDYHPVWSPDGKRIAYLSQNEIGFTFSIRVMDGNGANKSVVTSVNYGFCVWPWQDEWSLSWSPDGSRIAFQENGDIFIVNVDGTNRINLTDDSAWDSEPSWSADGTRIVFTSQRDFFRTLYSINVDGSNLVALPSDGEFWDSAPEFSPNGDKIAFVVNSSFNAPILYTANADGTNRMPFEGSGSNSHHRNKPKWSPDGSRIAFQMWASSGSDSEIYVRNIGRGQLIQLTNTVGSNFDPSWQPRPARIIPIGTEG